MPSLLRAVFAHIIALDKPSRQGKPVAILVLCAVTLGIVPRSAMGQSTPSASDFAAMKAVIQEYIDGYNAMDAKRTSACISAIYWHPDQFEKDQEGYFASLKKTEFRHIVMSEARRDPNGGTNYEIEVKSEMYEETLQSKQPTLIPIDTIYQLVQGNGQWKIVTFFKAEERVADAILSLLTREERQEYLQKNQGRLNLDVVMAIVNRVDQPGRDDPHRILDVAVEVAKVTDDHRTQPRIEMAIGFYKSMHNDPGGAIDAFTDAFRDWAKVPDVEGEAYAKADAGDSYAYVGRWPEAEKQYRESIALFEESANGAALLTQRISLGKTEAAQGRKKEAETDLTSAMLDADRTGRFYSEAQALSERAHLYLSQGRDEQGLADLQQSVEVSAKSADPAQEGRQLEEYAQSLLDKGRYEDTIQEAQAGVKFTNAENLLDAEVILLETKGRALDGLGQQDQALEAYSAALEASAPNPDPVMTARLHGEIADVLSRDFLVNSGDIENELIEADQAAYASNDSEAQGDIDLKRGQYVVHFLTMFEPLLLGVTSDSTWNTTYMREQIEDYQKKRPTLISFGQERLDRVVSTAVRTKNVYLEARGRATRAEFYAATQSDENMSLNEARAAIEAGFATDDATQLLCKESLARVLIMQKKWDQAVSALQDSIYLIETTRASIRVQNDRTSYFAANTWPYRAYARALLENGKNDETSRREAFVESERVRARALEDAFLGGNISATKKMTEEERGKDQMLAERVATAQIQLEALERLRTASGALIHEAQRGLRQAHEEQDDFRTNVLLSHATSSGTSTAPGMLDAANLNDALAVLKPGTAVVEYLMTDDLTMVFILKRDTAQGNKPTVEYAVLPVLRFELRKAIFSALAAFENPNRRYEDEATKLYGLLLAPIEKLLEGQKHLVIVPDGEIALVPFQALRNKAGFLLDSFSISYVPSLVAFGKTTQLETERRKQWQAQPGAKQNTMLAMGAPNYPPGFKQLPGAREELIQVASMFKAQSYLGADATRENALKLLPDARYVHFATHSRLDPFSSLRSAIVLTRTPTDDGFLEAQDLLNENLKAEMVVLSACDTGSGDSINGEGLQGLSWALFMAGSPTNIVTQWEVSDKSTLAVMEEFYRQLLSRPGTENAPGKLEALRAAQLKLKQDPKYAHPYYWAPYILTGAAD